MDNLLLVEDSLEMDSLDSEEDKVDLDLDYLEEVDQKVERRIGQVRLLDESRWTLVDWLWCLRRNDENI